MSGAGRVLALGRPDLNDVDLLNLFEMADLRQKMAEMGENLSGVVFPQKSGGGGNRTRVPRRFGEGFYVCSRLFVFRLNNPCRPGLQQASREPGLTQDVLDMILDDPDLTADF